MTQGRATMPQSGGAVTARQRRGGGGSFIVDRCGTVLGFDLEMERLTGWPAVSVVGRHKDLAPDLAAEDGPAHTPSTRPLFDGMVPSPAEAERFEMRLHCRDGRCLDVEAEATRLRGAAERIAVTVHRIIARSSAEATSLAPDSRDPITGLPGRAQFLRRLEAAVAEARGTGRPLALVLVDVDHLRHVNDRLGHQAGSEVLQRLAGAIRALVTHDDVACRLEDDDFAFLLTGAGRGEARQVAAQLRSNIERTRFFTRRGPDAVPVTVSLGAASYPADADNPTDLLGRAREALDEARAFGRNRVWCYLRRPRVPLQVPVYFDGVDSGLLGFSLDLSPSGIYVQTRDPIDIGMRCALAFPVPGAEGNVHVIGRVVRTVPPDAPVSAEARTPGMGIEFERLGSTDRRALEAFLHGQEATTRRPETGRFSV